MDFLDRCMLFGEVLFPCAQLIQANVFSGALVVSLLCSGNRTDPRGSTILLFGEGVRMPDPSEVEQFQRGARFSQLGPGVACMVKHPNTQHTVLQCPEQHSTSVARILKHRTACSPLASSTL